MNGRASLLLGAALAATSLPALATMYGVEIDTSAIQGEAGAIAFDLTSSTPGDNTATILNFTHDGSTGLPETQGGLVQGDIILLAHPAFFTQIGDQFFFNELVVPFTSFGTTISFTLQLTENFSGSGIPDELSFFVLGADRQVLFASGDPLGTDALFAICVDGTGTGLLSSFDPTIFTSPDLLQVSVPGSQVPCTDDGPCGDRFCRRSPGMCDAEGTCAQRPDDCPLVSEPVCGCDGETYPNACEAARAGVSIDFSGECNQPPVADAGPDQVRECTSPAGAAVTLDGSASIDPNGDPLAYAWTNSFGAAMGPTPTVQLGLGTHEILLGVDDGGGGSDSDRVSVTVEDTTAPEPEARLEAVFKKRPSAKKLASSKVLKKAIAFVVHAACTDACDVESHSEATVEGQSVADGDVLTKKVIKRLRKARRVTKAVKKAPPVLRLECIDASGNAAAVEVPATP